MISHLSLQGGDKVAEVAVCPHANTLATSTLYRVGGGGGGG